MKGVSHTHTQALSQNLLKLKLKEQLLFCALSPLSQSDAARRFMLPDILLSLADEVAC